MTLNEIAYDIINRVRGGFSVDDDTINIRQIYYLINAYRAKLLFQILKAQPDLIDEFTQDIGCIPVKCTDKADCCNNDSILWGESIYYVELPTLVDNTVLNNRGIYFVGSLDKRSRFTLVKNWQVKYKRYSRYTSQETFCYLIGNRLYIDMPKWKQMNYVNIHLVLADPAQSINFECAHQCQTFDEYADKAQYPFPVVFLADMTQAIIKEVMVVMASGHPDLLNDAQHQSVNPAAKEQPQQRRQQQQQQQSPYA